MKRFFLLVFVLCAVLLAVPVMAQDGEALPGVDEMAEGWNIIETGEETTCARGTPYQFFFRPGEDASRLMVYFQGGGACWNSLTCREGGTFDDSVSDDEFANYDGLFNFDSEENPIAGFNVVFVPYCTADIHTGDSTMTYGDWEIQHNGYDNSAVVLDWVYANFDAPEQVFVSGSSAGAYGAIYHAPFIINQYPDAQTAVLGDAGVGITPVGWPVLQDWDIFSNMPEFVPMLAEADPATFTANVLYTANSETYPDVNFGQFTNAADEVQIMFYSFSGPGLEAAMWVEGMYSALNDLDELANFSSYVAPGTGHTILALPEMYTLEVEGVRFLDWLNDLVNGAQPEAVRCVDCEAVAEAEAGS
ncbi:MAG: pectin acetylesterase-family hydrolase [Chloroflexota bacterium]